MTGSKVKIWKQDPSVKNIGIRTAYIPTQVLDGPKDQEIEIKGLSQVLSNANQDFIFNPQENPQDFDAVHTFSVVRQVLTMYQRVLVRNKVDIDLKWQWGSEPISVFPRAGEDANAYYSRNEKALRFFYFPDSNNNGSELVYTCRSFDIVAHEVGHAILDALRPGYWASWHPQTGGLHESFGDITAILTMLAQMDQCEAIVAESKGDLHAKSFFPALAEQFGEALGRPMGLRNADNDLTLSQVSNQVHDLSKVFTGAFYDILADIYCDYHKPDQYDQAETLFRVGKHMTSLVILALLKGPEQNATYADIANLMVEIEPVNEWKGFIQQQFSKREVLGGAASMAAVQPIELNWQGCCGTMRHEHHVQKVHAAVKTAEK